MKYLKIPGVSTMDIPFKTGEFVPEHWNLKVPYQSPIFNYANHLFKKAFPNLESGLNCFLGSTTNALPGITPSESACMTAMNLSIIGL